MVARLRDGFSLEQAQAETVRLTKQLSSDYRRYSDETYVVVPIAADVTSDIAEALRILFAAVAVVMLIVCANTAGLLLGRGTARTQEMAVRRAIGAGRVRVVRQLLTEGLVLSVLGAVGGLGLGQLIVSHFRSIIPDGAAWGHALIYADWIGMDSTAIGFAIGISVLAGVVFGVLPALQAARTNPSVHLKDAGAAGSSAGSRTRDWLVVLETTLAVVLVCSAGLLVRSSIALYEKGPGFQTEHRMSMQFHLENIPSAKRLQELNGITSGGGLLRAQMFTLSRRNLLERLAALPGVRGVAAASDVMTDQNGSIPFWVFRDGLPPNQRCEANVRYVTPNYFQVMGIPLLDGRVFDERDTLKPRSVGAIVVSPQLVRSCFGDEQPIDAQVQLFGNKATAPNYRVIGVVDDVQDEGIDRGALPAGYISTFQRPMEASLRVIVHADADPIALAPVLRHEIREFDRGSNPTLFGKSYRLEDLVRDSAWKLNYSTLMLGSLAGLALLLAAIGVYGVLSQSVRQRTREIGLRMALGAERSEVRRMIVQQGLRPVALGLVLGLAAAAAVTRLLGSLLYGVEPLDPLTFAAVIVVLLASALLASYIPARRAAQVDPMTALRHE